ncbi:Pre-mRNA-processing factor 6, partial [Zancudomyces culisetae]
CRMERLIQKNPVLFKTILNRAIAECPKSGALWAEAILCEPRPQRKAKSIDALKHCDNSDPVLLVTIGRLFWSERRVDKARTWFSRCIDLNPKYGDAYAWLYWLESETSTGTTTTTTTTTTSNPDSGSAEETDRLNAILTSVETNLPTHGEYWQQLSKDPKSNMLNASAKQILLQVVKVLKAQSSIL